MTALTAKCFARASLYLTEFLADANEFVVSSLEAIETSVAHIYLFALPCLRQTSKIAEAFWPKFNRVPPLHLAGIQRRVCCIASSAHGAHIVSGSEDKTLRVWDARTGEAVMEPFQGHTVVAGYFTPSKSVEGTEAKRRPKKQKTTPVTSSQPLQSDASSSSVKSTEIAPQKRNTHDTIWYFFTGPVNDHNFSKVIHEGDKRCSQDDYGHAGQSQWSIILMRQS
ncbi:hypothetical protein B0H14DRAFT_3440768 [Mycena olivaceomarginata]|nr:hypothetical protein B0H14DRAFT_3440768 [Mycena olivaceomarginata]